MMRRSSSLFLLLLLPLVCCGPHERVLPDPVDPVDVPRYASGLQFKSNMIGTSISYDILLPDGYVSDTETRYPLVVCFHGYGNDNTSWNNSYLTLESIVKSLEKKGFPKMIFVIPNGLKSYFCDRADGSYPYMTMIAEEFVPFIDKTYRTISDKEHRAVMGYSMGAFGALVNAMQRPDVFSACAALSISMRTDEQYKTESQGAWDNQWGRIFGGSGSIGAARLTDYYKSLCPLHQFTPENKAKYSSVKWFITCGDNEKQLLYANDDLHALMLGSGYEHEYRVGEGGHSESFWNTALKEVLPWLAYCFEGGSDWQETGLVPDVPADCTFAADGAYLSEGYVNAGKTQGTALYFFHKGLDAALLKDAMAILQRGLYLKKFVILPCDVTSKEPAGWVSQWEAEYTVTARQAIAVGEAGGALLRAQDSFSMLYFENADIDYKMEVDKSRTYFISQCDENPYYASSNALYKACKDNEVSFNYRCRNHMNDARTDFLTGIEVVKMNLKNL